MPANLIDKAAIKELAAKAAGLDNDQGEPRLKEVLNRLLYDVMVAIDDLDVSMNEFWSAIAYIGEAAKANELGLVVPGTALEHFLDLRLDEAERRAGLGGGTTRTIEGPLYVAGAPLVKGEARLDDDTDESEIPRQPLRLSDLVGGHKRSPTVLFMDGQVFDIAGNPVAGAIVDVWHANSFGFYSFFGPPQSPYNLRRRIETDREGRYRFRSIMPSGYGCPPGSNTEQLLTKLGRHGQRPAHIHFFVTSPGYRQLTTQINIDGDKYLHDDFAFGTRNDLIPPVERVSNAQEIHKAGLNKPFARIRFDFRLTRETAGAPSTVVHREHAVAA